MVAKEKLKASEGLDGNPKILSPDSSGLEDPPCETSRGCRNTETVEGFIELSC